MEERSLIDILRKIVVQETIWLRHYIGQIVSLADTAQKGRVCVTIQDLGFNTVDNGFWAYPRDKSGSYTPKQGDWVEIYFINGDRERPVYIGKAFEVPNQLPQSWDKTPTTSVIFESPNNKARIIHDEVKGKIQIQGQDLLEIGAGSEAMVKGTTLQPELNKDKTILDTLIAVLSAWVPVPSDGGSALKLALTASGVFGLPTADYSQMNSTKIKGE